MQYAQKFNIFDSYHKMQFFTNLSQKNFHENEYNLNKKNKTRWVKEGKANLKGKNQITENVN